MNRSFGFIILGAALLVVGCFMPWMHIPSTDITITGIDTTGTRYGKPAYTHFVFTALVVGFAAVPKIWAKRINLLFVALNMAWAARNFAVMSKCEGGVCPQKLTGLYLVLAGAIIMLIAALFPKEPSVKKK